MWVAINCTLPQSSHFYLPLPTTDTPDTSLNASGLSLPAFFNHLQQGDGSSTPQRTNSVDRLDSNQRNYIRMDLKYKRAMRKVRSHDSLLMCEVPNELRCFRFAVEQRDRHSKSTVAEATELLHTDKRTERPSGRFTAPPGGNDQLKEVTGADGFGCQWCECDAQSKHQTANGQNYFETCRRSFHRKSFGQEIEILNHQPI